MAIDLMGLVKGALNNDAINKLSSNLGESPASTQKAMEAGVPALLAAMLGKLTGGGGVSSLLSLFNSGSHDGSILGNLGGLLGGSGASNLMDSGKGILQSLLGDKLGPVSNLIASHAGVQSSSASSLLGLAGPLLMGAIGKASGPGGPTASSLTDLLNSQKASLAGALPSGLGNLVGLPSLSSVGAGAAHAAAGTAAAAGSSVSKWLWPAILALLVIGGLFWFMNRGAEPVKDVAGSVTDAAKSATTAVTDAAKTAISALGEFFKRKLPNGVELNIPKLGIENRLIDFIEDKSKPADKTTWFDFDRLLFDTGKATLQPASQEQLDNIASVLKAYPNVKVKLGGYTDNVGDKQFNMKLSDDRAKNVMAELVKLGIDPARMSAEGYGEDHPVADNSTEEGRAKNRRISLRVTEK
jgi:outer membrane protein OmpA-like peptidoglycan-associated protein